jgi:hypothetical protein
MVKVISLHCFFYYSHAYMLPAMGANKGGAHALFCTGALQGGGAAHVPKHLYTILVTLTQTGTLTASKWSLNKLASARYVSLSTIFPHPFGGQVFGAVHIYKIYPTSGYTEPRLSFCPWVGGVRTCWCVCLFVSLLGCSSWPSSV